MTFSEYLKAHRLTVETLAQAVGVDDHIIYLYKLAKGENLWSNVPLWYAAAVADVLGLNAQDLLDFDKVSGGE